MHSIHKHIYAYKCKNLASNISSVSTARNIYTIYDPALSLFQFSYVFLEAQEISNKIYSASWCLPWG